MEQSPFLQYLSPPFYLAVPDGGLGRAAVRARPALDPHRLRARTTDRQWDGGEAAGEPGMRALRGGAPPPLGIPARLEPSTPG
eukprot:2671009-Prymnesium_polylepis.1